MSIEHIFLDDGGVINNNALRGPQWQRLVAEFFTPRLGGTPEAWSEANRRILDDVFARFWTRIADWDDTSSDFRREIELYNLDWFTSMASEVGVEPPPSEADRLALAAESEAYIMPRVRVDLPGAVGAIHALAGGYTLFTASSGSSHELALTLSGMDVHHLFHRLYGPDLINMPKLDNRYYERVFADAGVDPAACLVLDDKPENLVAALTAGARAVLVGVRPAPPGIPSIAALAELPALLASGRLLQSMP